MSYSVTKRENIKRYSNVQKKLYQRKSPYNFTYMKIKNRQTSDRGPDKSYTGWNTGWEEVTGEMSRVLKCSGETSRVLKYSGLDVIGDNTGVNKCNSPSCPPRICDVSECKLQLNRFDERQKKVSNCHLLVFTTALRGKAS